MTAVTATFPTFPSLDKALEVHDFDKSRALYNGLLDDSDQPPVTNEHVANLAALFVHHNAEKVFGIHLIHGHFQIPKNTVMVGTNFENPALRWAKVTKIDSIDAGTVHGHIFALTQDGFCAYELQNGPLPDFSRVGQDFLPDFVNYIVRNNLTNLIGLQVLGCGDDSMSELILDQGTVMVDSSVIKNTCPSRITGWRFESVDGNPRVCQANETHAKMTTGNHKVFNAGKPLPKLDNVEDLKVALGEAGVL